MHLLTWDLIGTPGERHLRIRLQRNAKVLSYAILSHRWGEEEDEVSYEDMVSGHAEGKPGYTKILACCERAMRDGFSYVWVDTCCINKSSSAELSEAITSMYSYYQR